MQHEDEHDGVDLEQGAGEPDAARDGIVADPAAVDPVGHQGVEAEGGGDGGALEVLGLARGVLGDDGGGDVEAGEAGEAAQDEEGEAEVVEGRAQANGKGYYGGGEAEGDLRKGRECLLV